MSNNLDLSDIYSLVKDIDQQKGKYVKAVLTSLETSNRLDKDTRKIVLDGFNNFNRAVQRLLGYEIDQ
jgi:hypothetical protein